MLGWTPPAGSGSRASARARSGMTMDINALRRARRGQSSRFPSAGRTPLGAAGSPPATGARYSNSRASTTDPSSSATATARWCGVRGPIRAHAVRPGRLYREDLERGACLSHFSAHSTSTWLHHKFFHQKLALLWYHLLFLKKL